MVAAAPMITAAVITTAATAATAAPTTFAAVFAALASAEPALFAALAALAALIAILAATAAAAMVAVAATTVAATFAAALRALGSRSGCGGAAKKGFQPAEETAGFLRGGCGSRGARSAFLTAWLRLLVAERIPRPAFVARITRRTAVAFAAFATEALIAARTFAARIARGTEVVALPGLRRDGFRAFGRKNVQLGALVRCRPR